MSFFYVRRNKSRLSFRICALGGDRGTHGSSFASARADLHFAWLEQKYTIIEQ
jgi:hypothetical protein